jgi:hypothetical protein
MCPACVANAAFVIAGVVSSGGLTALVAKVLNGKNDLKKAIEIPNPKEATWAK